MVKTLFNQSKISQRKCLKFQWKLPDFSSVYTPPTAIMFTPINSPVIDVFNYPRQLECQRLDKLSFCLEVSTIGLSGWSYLVIICPGDTLPPPNYRCLYKSSVTVYSLISTQYHFTCILFEFFYDSIKIVELGSRE